MTSFSLGNVVAVSLSLAGAAAILATSALSLTVLKWVEAVYLIVIGLIAIMRTGKPDFSANANSGVSSLVAFLTNVIVGTLHPKNILFFVAFSAQFFRPDLPDIPQATTLVLTFTLVVTLTDTLYALSASHAAQMLRRDRAKRWSQRVGGGVFISAGLAMTAMRR